MQKTIHSTGHLALCEALIAARKAADLTQQELAQKLRCQQSKIARIESGQRRIDIVELIIWCRAVKANPQDILVKIEACVDEVERL